jgi:signal transduction histidine kinase
MTTNVHKFSLRSKSLLFLLGYALLLEGSMLVFLYVSGKNAINRQCRREVTAHAGVVRSAVEKALTDALAELDGLRAQLSLYPAPRRPTDPCLKLAEQLLLGAPRKYAEVRVSAGSEGREFVLRAVSEMGVLYAVTREGQAGASATCPSGTRSPCVVSTGGARAGELTRVVAPLDEGRSVSADVYVDSLIQAGAALVAPPRVSVLASTRSGLVLYAPDARLLRTRLEDTQLPGLVSDSNVVDSLGVVLTARKDPGADLGELRANLVRMASFAGALTLIAFLCAWALTGQMAASLQHVADVADSVAAGDFSRRIAIRRDDELGALIDSFNGMTERLEASYGQLREVNRHLEAKVEELARTRRRLVEKERLAAVGEALSKISHEIQNKIGGVGVWVQNLERYGARDEHTTVCVAEMKLALASFLDMLAHFKRFYRAPQLTRGPIAVRRLLDSSLACVAAATRAKDLRVEYHASDAVAEVDVGQMTDAIVNVLLNAVNFSPPGGTLFVETRTNLRQVIISVRDQGCGFTSDARPFQPFYTTRAEGSGLGLAIARNIVRAHGGRVRAYNNPDSGACVEIAVPLAAAAP